MLWLRSMGPVSVVVYPQFEELVAPARLRHRSVPNLRLDYQQVLDW